MTWSYTDSPASIPRDKVRFLVGDTKQQAHSLSDDEIAFLIAEGGSNANQYEAAALAAEAMAARLTGNSGTSKKVGDLSINTDHGATAERYLARARELRAKINKGAMFLPVYADAPSIFSVGADDFIEDLK